MNHDDIENPIVVKDGNGKVWKLVIALCSGLIVLAGGAIGALLLNDRANLVGQIQAASALADKQQDSLIELNKELGALRDRVNVIQERQDNVRAQLQVNSQKLDEVITRLTAMNKKL